MDTEITNGAEGAEAAAGTLLTDQPGNQGNNDTSGDGGKSNADVSGNDEADKGKDGADAVKPNEPEPFELTAPDGYPINDAGLKGLNDLCRSAKLTKEQGEAVMQYMAGNYSTWQEQQQAQGKAWIEEFKADKDFGGDKFDSSVAEAQKALATFDESGDVRAMLAETGYGNNPAVLRIFARVGRALGEDKLPGMSGGAEDKPLEDRFYPNM